MAKKFESEYDWRLQAVATLTSNGKGPLGHKFKKGHAVVLVHPVKIDNKMTSITTPHPTAIFLNLSNSSYNQSIKLFNFKKLINKDLEEKIYLDSLEHYIASIIFAFTSIEVFSNYSIPDTFEFKKIRDDNKCIEVFNKDRIEKYISLDLKISEILPIIYDVSSFKGTSLWEQYLDLKKIRDKLIHLKTIDTKNTPDNPFNHLWNDLINNGELLNYSKKAKRIIKYFLKNKKHRWFERCPF